MHFVYAYYIQSNVNAVYRNGHTKSGISRRMQNIGKRRYPGSRDPGIIKTVHNTTYGLETTMRGLIKELLR